MYPPFFFLGVVVLTPHHPARSGYVFRSIMRACVPGMKDKTREPENWRSGVRHITLTPSLQRDTTEVRIGLKFLIPGALTSVADAYGLP